MRKIKPKNQTQRALHDFVNSTGLPIIDALESASSLTGLSASTLKSVYYWNYGRLGPSESVSESVRSLKSGASV